MQLPSSYLAYHVPTLVLVCDRAQASIYLAHERDILAVDRLTNDRAHVGNKEHYVTSVSGGVRFSKAQDETLKDREAAAFYHRIAQRVFDLFQERAFGACVIAVPRNDKNILLDAIHTDARALLTVVIAKQLTKQPDDELFVTIDAARHSPSS